MNKTVSKSRKLPNKKALIVIVVILFIVVFAATAFSVMSAMLGQINKNDSMVSNGVKNVAVADDSPAEDVPNDFYCLLLGVDQNKDRDKKQTTDGTYRSDTIILAHIDVSRNDVSLCSFHRDIKTRIDSDGFKDEKLNASYSTGGLESVKEEVCQMTGIDEIPYYAIINMDGLESLVDILGGVEVDVPVDINDSHVGNVTFEKGFQVLDGKQALALCRSRHSYDSMNVDGDVMRAKAQRDVIKAIAKKAKGISPTQLLPMFNTMKDNLATNFSTGQMLTLAQKFSGSNVIDNMNSLMTPTVPHYDGTVWYECLDPVKWVTVKDCLHNFKKLPEGFANAESGFEVPDDFPGYSPDEQFYDDSSYESEAISKNPEETASSESENSGYGNATNSEIKEEEVEVAVK